MANLEWYKIMVTEDRAICKSEHIVLEVNLNWLKILCINNVINWNQKDPQQIYITFLTVMKNKASMSEFESNGIYQTKGRRNHTRFHLLLCIRLSIGVWFNNSNMTSHAHWNWTSTFLKFTGFNLIVGIYMLSENILLLLSSSTNNL